MTNSEVIEVLEKEESYMLSHGGDRQAKALRIAIDKIEQEPCKDAISLASVFEIMGNLMSIPYDFDRSITEKDVSESMDEVRELPRVTPQEQFKPMVEIDLYSVIKQKYIEREVLNKIRAEIEKLQKMCDKNDLNLIAQYSAFGMALDVIDKYRQEGGEDERKV